MVYGEKFARHNRNFMLKMLENGILHYFLAKKDKQTVGFISIIEHADNIEIYDLYVLPDFRRKGIAAALQKKALYSHDKNFIVVANHSDTPKFMYQKWGYHQIGMVILKWTPKISELEKGQFSMKRKHSSKGFKYQAVSPILTDKHPVRYVSK